MTEAGRRRKAGAALWIVVCVVGGCAVERITAVEPIDSGTGDAGSTGVDASIGGAADASSDGMGSSSSGEDGADAGTASSGCTSANAAFTTSAPQGQTPTDDAGYIIRNNMWNTDAGPGPQVLYVCSHRSWYVVSEQTDDAGTGAVKTYPNVQMNFNDVPISSFHGVASTFAETSPPVGIYEDAYDIWLNGVAKAGSNQIMIWVDNHGRTPAGSQVTTTTTKSGHPYYVWKTSDDSQITLVSTVAFPSGQVDLLEIFNWTIAQGWLPPSSTLGQIDFGVEIESTDGASATFRFNDFSIATN